MAQKPSAKKRRTGRGGGGGKAKGLITTDHDQIRRWAEARGAKPACVKGTGGRGDTGLLRLDFPGYSGEGSLQAVTWDEFFEKFDQQKLALLYQEQTAGGEASNFNKLVRRGATGRAGSSSARKAVKKTAKKAAPKKSSAKRR